MIKEDPIKCYAFASTNDLPGTGYPDRSPVLDDLMKEEPDEILEQVLTFNFLEDKTQKEVPVMYGMWSTPTGTVTFMMKYGYK